MKALQHCAWVPVTKIQTGIYSRLITSPFGMVWITKSVTGITSGSSTKRSKVGKTSLYIYEMWRWRARFITKIPTRKSLENWNMKLIQMGIFAASCGTVTVVKWQPRKSITTIHVRMYVHVSTLFCLPSCTYRVSARRPTAFLSSHRVTPFIYLNSGGSVPVRLPILLYSLGTPLYRIYPPAFAQSCNLFSQHYYL